MMYFCNQLRIMFQISMMKVNFRTKKHALVVKHSESRAGKNFDERQESAKAQNKKTFQHDPHTSSAFDFVKSDWTDYTHDLHEKLEPRDRKVIVPYSLQEQGEFWLQSDLRELYEWVGNMYFAVVSASFQLLIGKSLSYEQVKIFCSENMLLNILLLMQQVPESHNIQIAKQLNNRLKDTLEYLLSKYPQAKQIKPNKKLRQAITSLNNIQNDENDMLRTSGIEFSIKQDADYTSDIMKFINFLIGLPTQQVEYHGKLKTYYQIFSQVMEKIFDWVHYTEESKPEDQLYQWLIEEKIEQEEDISEFDYQFQNNVQQEELVIQQDEQPQFRPKKIKGQGIKKRKYVKQEDRQTKQYKEKVKKYTSYLIGPKINPNTEIYKDYEISQGYFMVKSTAILRVLSKWTEELEKKLFQAKEVILNRSFRFKSKDGDFIKLNTSEKNNLFQGAEFYLPEIKSFVNTIKDDCMEIQARLSTLLDKTKKMMHVPKHEYMVGQFCSKLESAASTYQLKYLNKIMHALLLLPEDNVEQNRKDVKSKNVNLLTFKISDLLRCKCASHENQIIRIFNLIKRVSQSDHNLLKIVRIKDRLEKGTRDILININFMNKILCQIQLAVTDEIDQKQKMYDSFNHYLYELKRSNLGPVMESACIWTHLDQRSKLFKNIKHKPALQSIIQLNYRKHECSLEAMEKHPFSFVCSLCGVFYPSPKGLISSRKCSACNKYYECRNCIQNMMGSGELKHFLNLNQNQMRHFDEDFQEWKASENKDKSFPNFCVLIPKQHKKKKYFFTQKIVLKSISYLLNIQENEKKELSVSTIFTLKEGKDIFKLNDEFYIFQWMEKRQINRTMTAAHQHQLLKRQEELEEEKEAKKEEQREKTKKQVKERRRMEEKRWLRLEVVDESSDEEEEEEKEVVRHRRRRRRKEEQQDEQNKRNRKRKGNMFRFQRGNEENISRRNSVMSSRQHSEVSERSDTSVKRKKRKIIGQIEDKDKEQFVELWCKRSQYNNIRISEKQVGEKNYYLVLGFYMKESQLKAHIKSQLNKKAFNERLANKSEVISMEEQQLNKELELEFSSIKLFQASLRHITEMYIDQNKIKSLNFIRQFPKLSILHANSNFIDSIDSLTKLRQLTEVKLSNNWIQEIEGLKNSGKIVDLDLSKNRIMKIEGLEDLIELKKLYLCSNSIREISGLENQVKLKQLNLGINCIQIIEGLEKLSNLEKLFLFGNEIKKIQNLDSQIELTQLLLNHNQITQIQNLGKMKKLTYLSIYSNCLNQIGGLQEMTQLKRLELGKNKIQKIQKLTQLRSLEFLGISRNKISKLEYDSIESLSNLKQLSLSSNYLRVISDDLLEFLPKLEILDLINNPLKIGNITNIKSLGKIKQSLKNFTYLP